MNSNVSSSSDSDRRLKGVGTCFETHPPPAKRCRLTRLLGRGRPPQQDRPGRLRWFRGRHVVVRCSVRIIGPFWQVLQQDGSLVVNEPWDGHPFGRDKIGMPRRKMWPHSLRLSTKSLAAGVCEASRYGPCTVRFRLCLGVG